MNFDDERFVKIFTRDTVTWKLLGWEGRCVLLMLLRKVDRAGCLDVPPEGMEGLCLLLDLPEDITERGLAACLRRGCVVHTGTALTIPRFIAGQESRQSDKLRQQESRAKRRDCAMRGIDMPLAKTWIYFIRDVDAGTIKIGYAADVPSRLNNISGGRPEKCQLLTTYPGGIDEERKEHARWAALRIGSTEWFTPSADLEAYIQSVTARDQTSRAVTASHTLSHPVTLRIEQTRPDQNKTDSDVPSEPSQPALALQPQQAADTTKKPSEAQVRERIALVLFGEIVAARMSVIPGAEKLEPRPAALAGLKACLGQGYKPDEIRRVIDLKTREVRADPKQAKWFRPTWFSPGNVEGYLALRPQDVTSARPSHASGYQGRPAPNEPPKSPRAGESDFQRQIRESRERGEIQ